MALTKEMVKEQRPNLVWWLLAWVVTSLLNTATVTAWLRYAKSVPLDVKLIVGLFAVSLVGLGVLLLLARRHSVTPPVTATEPASSLICPYEWSHTVIALQAKSVGSWIYFERCHLDDLDLERTHPFLVFSIKLRNGSIFRVSLMGFEGAIIYGGRHIEGKAQWVGSPLQLQPGERDTAVFKYSIDAGEDALYMRNMGGRFELRDLKLSIESDPQTPQSSHSLGGDVPATMIGLKYPKLAIEIKRALLTTHYNFDSEFIEDSPTGCYVSLLTESRNPRTARITVAEFKLDTSPHVDRVTSGTRGLIYQNVWLMEGKVEHHTRLTPNLSDDVPIQADREDPIEGWIQFYLSRVKADELAGKGVNLIIIDRAGEEHIRGTPPLETQSRNAPRTSAG